jgi:hypothetical protein
VKEHIIDRIDKALFNPTGIKLSEKESEILERIRSAFTVWLDNPMKTDGEIRDFLMSKYKISKSQAYRDIFNTKICLGNIKSASKEWQRYRANQIVEQAYRAAVEGDHKLAKSLTLVAMALSKINKLETEEGEQMQWDEIVPQSFEPSTDPESIGLKPIPNLKEKIENLKKKYIDEISVTIPFDEIKDNGDSKENIFQ